MTASISVGLVRRLRRQDKKQREGLAQLIATMLDVRSANLMDLSASLPRDAERIDTDRVMAPFVAEVPGRVSADGQTTVLIIDQTKADEPRQAVVVASRVGGRVPTNIGRSRLRQRCMRRGIPSRASSPCRTSRRRRGRSTTACVAGSRRCSRTSKAAASGSRTAGCNAPTGWIA